MPLTPADVHNVAFKKPPIGKRGYDEEEVDAFLDEVERELARLIEENNDLRTQADRARSNGPVPGSAVPGPADHDARRLNAEIVELKAQLDRSMQEKMAAQQAAQKAQQAAAQAVSSARAVPTQPATSETGESQALRVLMLAQRTAEEHVNDARKEAETLLNDARTKADAVTREARSKADALERDARQRHEEAMGGLDAKRTALQKHIEELKAFEREYRTRLKAYLESQLRDLEGRAQALEAQTTGSSGSPSEPSVSFGPIGGAFGAIGGRP